jgi:hypothetical protein
VIADWRCPYYLEESYLDPALNWDGPFPGGEDLWPKALCDPVRFVSDVHFDIGADSFCNFILSWEPI